MKFHEIELSISLDQLAGPHSTTTAIRAATPTTAARTVQHATTVQRTTTAIQPSTTTVQSESAVQQSVQQSIQPTGSATECGEVPADRKSEHNSPFIYDLDKRVGHI